jgi:uncharacterized membrane protein YheB (UPF0754 family)
MNTASFIQDYWVYLTIPVVSALVGYTTNWLAVKMMMWPVEFKGLGPLGWQGVVPANSAKMARIVVEHSIKQVLTQQELIDRIDPLELIESVNYRLEPIVEDLVDEVMTEASNYGLPVGNLVWGASPIWLKNKVYREVKNKLPEIIVKIIDDLKQNIDELIDINELVAEKLTNDKHLLIDIFLTAGKKEFTFVERSGLYFGLPLGIPVMFIWYFYPVWWILPLFGFLVGYITNSLAIYLVFKPLQPKTIGPFTFQGLFIKRQKEISRYYGHVFANDLVKGEVLVARMLKEQHSVERLRQLIQREVNHGIDTYQGSLQTLTVMSMGFHEYARIARIISDRAFKELLHPEKRSFQYLDQALDIENTIATRVGNLPPEEFYQLLYPVIEEDEWKLIAVGAVLGLCAGFLQLLVLGSG